MPHVSRPLPFAPSAAITTLLVLAVVAGLMGFAAVAVALEHAAA